ncbi:hypothetical protein IMZ48_45145 [Candidatus Bathyarchaeota archaeon]|nr:hypothetical protein [Candidatus Bathyarchaeota archaeon]
MFHVAGAAAASGQLVSEVVEAQGGGYMEEVAEYAEVDLGGLDFDANDFNAFNAEVWSMLNYN